MIHQYKNNGYNIVLDVNSGSVHVVDDIVYDIIALYENSSVDEIADKLKDKYKEEDIREACQEIEELKEEGQLFTEDIYEPYIDSFKDRPTVVSVKRNFLLCSSSRLLPYSTSCFTTSKFIVGSPPKKSTSRFLLEPELATRKSNAFLPTSKLIRALLP